MAFRGPSDTYPSTAVVAAAIALGRTLRRAGLASSALPLTGFHKLFTCGTCAHARFCCPFM